MVHPYDIEPPPESKDGPYVAVFLSTHDDLESLAERLTDHLYFELLPCSRRSHRYDLFSGRVFRCMVEDRSAVFGTSAPTSRGLYKVHIPLSLERIMRAAGIFGGLDLPAYLDLARKDGLCVRLGGAKMCCAEMFSNVVSIPVAIRGDALVVTGESWP